MQPPIDFDPPIGVPECVATGVRRIIAPNPSPMTFRGTNTYIVGTGDVAVIDPGPHSMKHLFALLAALDPGEKITHIVLTHSHLDHSPLAAILKRETGAPIYGFGPATKSRSPIMTALAQSGHGGGGEGIDIGFAPDFELDDGARISGETWQLEAIHTPGHIANHLCFAFGDLLFSGDHVMGWATSLVSPPDGDLTAFMASCHKLRTRPETLYLPGHGAPVADATTRVQWLIDHRLGREAQILALLAQAPATPTALTQAIYTDVDPALLPAAERNVFAHLIDLYIRSIVICDGPLSPQNTFRSAP
jgi:glyoxylase-like metal-dependent hydrolase (beta-lactamase superfamily II)